VPSASVHQRSVAGQITSAIPRGVTGDHPVCSTHPKTPLNHQHLTESPSGGAATRKQIVPMELIPDPQPAALRSTRDGGFTLVEIVIAIVLVGILSAVVVVGVGNLTSKGTEAACAASLDASKAGSVVHYSSNNSAWPATILAMTGGVPPSLSLPSGVTLNTSVVGPSAIGNVATGSGWTLTMTPSVAGAQPTFVCA